MKFCIAKVDFWESVGFNPYGWRKSSDETKAICHYKFAEKLVSNIEKNRNIDTYDIDNEEFNDILTKEFTNG